MKPRLLALLLAAGALTAACSDDNASTSPEGEARVRVVHASPDAPAVDVLVDNTSVLTAVPYRAASTYLALAAGERNLKVNAAGTSTAVIDANVSLADATDYTVIASGLVAAIEPIVLEDDNSVPAAGRARVRAIHGAASAPAVDIYVTAPGADLATATPALTNVKFGDVADYIEAPAGDYQVRVTPTGSKTTVIDSGTLSLASGQVRTAIAVDAPGGGAPFGLLLLEDLN
jgi:ABC-type glycerol-3-phosphate transport system substrate-binding protein